MTIVRRDLDALLQEFGLAYLNTPKGQRHLASYEESRAAARRNWEEIRTKQAAGEDVTDLVLTKLLPHQNTSHNRARGAWICIAPAVTKDIREWFEGAGWVEPARWPQIAAEVLRFLTRVIDDPGSLEAACSDFENSPNSKGIRTAFLSPFMNAMRPDDYLLLNKKSNETLALLTGEKFSSHLTTYPQANAALWRVVRELEPRLRALTPSARPGDVFDQFSHFAIGIKELQKLSRGEGGTSDAGQIHEGSLGGRRQSQESVAEIVEEMLPDPNQRKIALTFLVDAIEEVRKTHPDSWTLNLGRKTVRLNVGRLLVMDLLPMAIRLSLDAKDLDPSIRSRVEREVGSGEFRTAPGVCFHLLPSDLFVELVEDLREPFRKVLVRAAATASSSPYTRAYSPGALAYLERETGRRLPSPGRRASDSIQLARSRVRNWKVAPGNQAWQWPDCLRDGFIAVGWNELGDCTGISDEAFTQRLERLRAEVPTDPWSPFGAGQVLKFSRIKPGDRVVANRGTTEVLGIGTVTGPYRFVPDAQHAHQLPVRWEDSRTRRVSKNGWHKTLVELDQNEFEEILAAPIVEVDASASMVREDEHPSIEGVSGLKPAIGLRAFELLEGLHDSPTREYLQEHRGELELELQEPFKRLFAQVVTRLSAPIVDVMETERNVFSRIPKNDYGRGGAWDFLWGALYPKEGRRVEDAQLSLGIHWQRFTFGFALGRYGTEQEARFMRNWQRGCGAQIVPHLERYAARRALQYGTSGEDTPSAWASPLTLSDWARNPREHGIRVEEVLPRTTFLAIDAESLADHIAELFETLFPLVLLTLFDDAREALNQYFGEYEVEAQPVYSEEHLTRETSLDAGVVRPRRPPKIPHSWPPEIPPP